MHLLVLSEMQGDFHGQGSINTQQPELTGSLGGRISECRSSIQDVKVWCRENGVCEQTYYKWQRRLFEMVQVLQKIHIAEVAPSQLDSCSNVVVTARISSVEADIYPGADVATVETVLRILKSY